MMAVRILSAVLVAMVVGCSSGADSGTGAEVPTGTARGGEDAAVAADSAGTSSGEDAGDQVDGGARSDAGSLPDANASKPPGNTLSNAADAGAPWSEGDPAKLYPYVAAYSYPGNGTPTVEIEFSSTPATEQLGRRIVVVCGLLKCSGQAFVRNERKCFESVVTGQITPADQPLHIGGTGPYTLTGHVSGVAFPNLGELAVDISNLPVETASARHCSDGTNG